MIENEFTKTALSNELTSEKVKNFFEQTPPEEIKISLRDLARRASPDSEDWHGLPSGFTKMIRDIGSPQAMSLYIKYYIGNCERVHPKLSLEDFLWFIKKINQGAKEGLLIYISGVALSPDQQILVCSSYNADLFDKMCEKQKIAPEIQKYLVNDYTSATDKIFGMANEKLHTYIKYHSFCEDVEQLFLCSSAPSSFKKEYIKRHGLSAKMSNMMLFEVWDNIIKQV